ncbi:MAG TPA: winged helix-turn-helix transcriptional regulator [Candidatus Diapherotrites archaeon]|uniref:Winged helix-turn-helix transcriptional regulator n=1 Tax=Candidatus Iainarchaeum sp. TaxID=3101447 RepID=A0A7J4JLD3_9ARCH|nr:winged helix-turn-helix transcriptional regulator [Candidatus Diapherotrites archaeon]HIH16717.1 winged helix-turn-helix transcriptional regulator [Candidatus Diapherotrites archaeon]
MNAVPYKLCFETLANDLRLQILETLKEGPKPVSEIARALAAEQSRVSHSLEILRACNYVNAEKKGKQRIYSLREMPHSHDNQSGLSVIQIMNQHVTHCCQNECKRLDCK